MVKAEFEKIAKEAFAGTHINITTHGKRHPGVAIGSRTFTEEYVSIKWKVGPKTYPLRHIMAQIASSQPHAACAAYIHGLSGRWSYPIRTIPHIDDLQKLLKNAIQAFLIPALTGRIHAPLSRDLLALPVRLGGLGLRDPSTMPSGCFQSSQSITAPLLH